MNDELKLRSKDIKSQMGELEDTIRAQKEFILDQNSKLEQQNMDMKQLHADVEFLKQAKVTPTDQKAFFKQSSKFDLRNKTLKERQAILKGVLANKGTRIKLVERKKLNTLDDLVDVKSKNLIFKRESDSYYPTGANTTQWLKVNNPTLKPKVNAENKIHQTIETLSLVAQLKRDGRIISGTAIREGYHNGKFYPFRELERAFESLKEKELRFGHQENLPVGMVINVWLDYKTKSIEFQARIDNELMSTQVAMGDYDSVSVGLWLEELPARNVLSAPTVINIDFTELSIVMKGACTGAKIKHVEDIPEE